jgi:hypothetical protein
MQYSTYSTPPEEQSVVAQVVGMCVVRLHRHLVVLLQCVYGVWGVGLIDRCTIQREDLIRHMTYDI